MAEGKSVKAVAKYIRMSPQKVRRVLNQLRGRSYQEALMILEFLSYSAVGPIWQVLHSAAANAEHNYGLDKKSLIIEQSYADEGPKLKRIRPRAQGRAYAILKPTCHITIVVKSLV
jgi:large subunit ribosomal protein L22|tara:strand:- start:21362 stop:21709 length:348 start_codon:yes stop_codon:yes gene_type:complete|mmetsp:Transcript_4566/g.4722  ORF Transcript_4566/g.4722 Transcript_4566/m.4722 type:complete len:116 (+) Transcript_4566:4412-4759(+)